MLFFTVKNYSENYFLRFDKAASLHRYLTHDVDSKGTEKPHVRHETSIHVIV